MSNSTYSGLLSTVMLNLGNKIMCVLLENLILRLLIRDKEMGSQ
jgi:hypothetical protein